MKNYSRIRRMKKKKLENSMKINRVAWIVNGFSMDYYNRFKGKHKYE